MLILTISRLKVARLYVFRYFHIMKKTIAKCAILILLSITPLLKAQQSSSLLWEVTGKNLEKPSYLYGTMHVSKKVAFHLSDSFFIALKSVDMVGLETNPETWLEDMLGSSYIQNFMQTSKVDLYGDAFKITPPDNSNLALCLSEEQTLINPLLFRYNPGNEDFEEMTYLDLFIYQAGRKYGKEVTAMEYFEETMEFAVKGSVPDENPVEVSQSDVNRFMKDGKGFQEIVEDAYRNGDLNLLDSIYIYLYPSKNFRKGMLDERNKIMANNMDSILKTKSIFAGLGAAHLPGNNGMIQLLRDKGYKVRPVERVLINRSSKYKDKINKMFADTDFKTYFTDDKLISVKTPYPLVRTPSYSDRINYVSTDMANGAYYNITKTKHFGQIKHQDPAFIAKRLDSLIYENIPGKIIKKTEIERNGLKGITLKSKTIKGYLNQFEIYISEHDLIVIKMSGREKYVKGKAGMTFFNSIQFHLKESNDQFVTAGPTYGDFEVKLPTNYIDHSKDLKKDMGTNQDYIAVAEGANKDYYIVQKTHYFDYSYIEEDSFELRAIAESFYKDLNYTLVEKKATTIGQYPAMDFDLISKDSSEHLYLRSIIKGANYYLLAGFTKERPEQFINSFKFKEIIYTDSLELHEDTSAFFSVNTYGRTPKNKRSNYNLFGSSSKKKDTKYLSDSKYITFTVPSTGEQIKIYFVKHHDYYSREDIEDYWEVKRNSLIKDNTMKISNEKRYTDSIHYHFEALLTDTASSRGILIHYILQNGSYYKIKYVMDTIEGPTPFYTHFMENFNISDSIIGKSPFDDKMRILLRETLSEDSTTLDRVVNVLDRYIYNTTDINETHYDSLMIAIKNNNFNDDHGLDPKATLIEQLGEFPKKEVIQYLKETFTTAQDTTTIQIAALNALTEMRTKESFLAYKKLISEETPLPSSKYKLYSMFTDIEDTIELTKHLFPEFMELTIYPEYKDKVLGLLAHALDSNAIDVKVIESYKKRLIKEANDEVKRHLSGQEKSDSYYSYDNNDDLLEDYARILTHFPKDSKITKFYDKLLKSTDHGVQMDIIEVRLNHNLAVHDSIYHNLAEDDETRIAIYDLLKKHDMLEKFDTTYLNQEAFARALLVDEENMGEEDSLEYLNIKKNVYTKDFSGVVYVYKAQTGYDDKWSYAYVYQPKDSNEVTSEPLIIRTGSSYTKDDDIESLIKEDMEPFFFIGRSRYKGNFSNDYSNLF